MHVSSAAIPLPRNSALRGSNEEDPSGTQVWQGRTHLRSVRHSPPVGLSLVGVLAVCCGRWWAKEEDARAGLEAVLVLPFCRRPLCSVRTLTEPRVGRARSVCVLFATHSPFPSVAQGFWRFVVGGGGQKRKTREQDSRRSLPCHSSSSLVFSEDPHRTQGW